MSDGGISRIAYRVSRPFDAAQGRIAYLGEKRGLEEKGRVVNQKNHNESVRPFDDAQGRQAQDRFAGFFNRPPVCVVSSNKFTGEIAETTEDR